MIYEHTQSPPTQASGVRVLCEYREGIPDPSGPSNCQVKAEDGFEG